MRGSATLLLTDLDVWEKRGIHTDGVASLIAGIRHPDLSEKVEIS